MEELLPLIIGILWLLYTFYSKGQKKKAQRRSPSTGEEPRRKPTFIEQLLAGEGIQIGPEEQFEEIEEEIEEEVELHPYEKTTLASEKSKYRPFLQTELSAYKEEGQSQFSHSFKYDENTDSDIFGQDLDLGLEKDDFDLKKAVVFSTILNAPYIDYK